MRTLHPVLTPGERARLLRSGVDHFVAGRYFSSHEAFEEVWRSTTPEPRELLQALVQVAAALHNALVRGCPRGASRTLSKAVVRLAGRPAVELGLDLRSFTVDLDPWRVWLDRGGTDPSPAPPRLQLVVPQDLR